MKSTSTIDRLYDQYKLQDWNINDINADNLNPKREMILGQVKQLEKAIQVLADDIVRKRVTPKKDVVEELRTSFGGESIIGSLGKNISAINAGSSDGTIFDNGLTSDIEEQVALLQANLGPLTIDCEKILSKYGFNVAPSEPIDEDDGETTFVVNTKDLDSSNNNFRNNRDQYSDILDNDCAAADLAILEIFIAILKIFQIIVQILNYIIEFPTVIAEIVELIAMCWLNPPSIALATMVVLDLLTSIVVALISSLVKFLWDLLGLDCVAVQSTEMLDKIQELLTSFKNTAASIDIGAVNFMFDGIGNQLTNISDIIKGVAGDWNEAVANVKNYFSEEGLKNLKDAAVGAATNTLQEEYSKTMGNVKGNVNQTLFEGIDKVNRFMTNGNLIQNAKDKAIEEYNKMIDTYESAVQNASSTIDNLKASFSRMRDAHNKLGEFFSDPSLDNMEIE
jgi:hypothetical protein